LDLDALLRSIVSQAIELLGGTSGGLYLYQPQEDMLEWVMAVGAQLPPVGSILQRGEGLSGRVWETGEPLIVDAYQQWEGQAAIYEGYPWTAVVGVPVRWGEDFLGVLNVLAAPPHTFSPADAQLLSLFATQAAIAIKNARLYATQQQLAQESSTLLDIAKATTSTLDMTEVLKLVAQRAAQACVADRCTILLLDEEGRKLVPLMSQFSSGQADKELWRVFRDRTYAGTVDEILAIKELIRDRVPAIFDRNSLSLLPRRWIEPFDIQSLLVVPLVSKDEVIGVMALDYTDEGQRFSDEQVALATTIASQAAMAIENAKLYERVERSVEQLTALRQTALDITARLDATPLLEAILRRATELLTAKGGGIYLYDPTRQELTVAVDYGLRRSVVGTTLKLGEGMAGRVAQTGEPIIVDDYRTWSGRSKKYADDLFTAVVEVPLKWQSQVIGVLVVVDELGERVFTEDDAQLLSLFADQAAIAIENARLYDATQRELAERKRAEEALRKAHDELEIRVQERTAELVEANRALRAEIIERKRAEEQLKQYELIVESANDALFIKDLQSRYILVNDKVLKLFGGIPRERIVGKTDKELMPLEDALHNITDDQEVFNTGKQRDFVKKNTIEGKDYWFHATKIPLRDDKGKIIGLVGIARDITESKRMEEELRRAYSDLRDSQVRLIQSEKLAATGRLAASVAHEINNPLQGISNYLAVIFQQVSEETPLHEDLEMVKLGFERISEIVRRLRAFYRPAEEEMEPTDINEVVDRVLALLGHQLSLGQVEVKTELAEQELPVLGSVGQLEQVLVNLVLNAQEAMPQGGELIVRTASFDNQVQLQVSDTGHGIGEEERGRLFKPFYGGRGGKGLGLGLWISHNIIEGHGGRIEVESGVGQGTTFTISLPAYQRER
jgi:PAS domain S-box-containing protein